MSTSTGVTARKAHPCETCSRRDANGTWSTPIHPGHRYLRHVVFPGNDGFEEGTRPQSIRECAGCAIERDGDAAMTYAICGSYCCGTTPCALPFEQGAPTHDHSCGECVRAAAAPR